MGSRECKRCHSLEDAAHDSCVKHYLHFARKFDRKIKNKTNPFHVAAERDHFNMIPLLAQSRNELDINCLDILSQTPLMISIENNNFQSSIALLKLGANATIKGDGGQTAIDVALRNPYAGESVHVLFCLCTKVKIFLLRWLQIYNVIEKYEDFGMKNHK